MMPGTDLRVDIYDWPSAFSARCEARTAAIAATFLLEADYLQLRAALRLNDVPAAREALRGLQQNIANAAEFLDMAFGPEIPL